MGEFPIPQGTADVRNRGPKGEKITKAQSHGIFSLEIKGKTCNKNQIAITVQRIQIKSLLYLTRNFNHNLYNLIYTDRNDP